MHTLILAYQRALLLCSVCSKSGYVLISQVKTLMHQKFECLRLLHPENKDP